jgi:hydroxymethylpyrimidine/phosphomethylpyrimidine kinase
MGARRRGRRLYSRQHHGFHSRGDKEIVTMLPRADPHTGSTCRFSSCVASRLARRIQKSLFAEDIEKWAKVVKFSGAKPDWIRGAAMGQIPTSWR